jgi:hypothetical protein
VHETVVEAGEDRKNAVGFDPQDIGGASKESCCIHR